MHQTNDQEHQEGSFAQLEDVDGECLLCFLILTQQPLLQLHFTYNPCQHSAANQQGWQGYAVHTCQVQELG